MWKKGIDKEKLQLVYDNASEGEKFANSLVDFLMVRRAICAISLNCQSYLPQKHRDHHYKIIERIKAIQRMYSNHELSIITNLSSPLKNRFMEDLIEEDKKLSEYLSSKGAA